MLLVAGQTKVLGDEGDVASLKSTLMPAKGPQWKSMLGRMGRAGAE